MRLSATVITFNEEQNINACLSSLRFADEIVVVDSGSCDRTVEIAKNFTNKVYVRPFDDFSSQKNHAASKASGEWVLSIDADESVSSQLAAEIQSAIASDKADGYFLPRRTRMFGRNFRFSGLQNDKPLRLYRKQSGQFQGEVHERVRVSGGVGSLKNALDHSSFQTLNDYMRRLQQYTSLERGLSRPKTRDFTLRPLYRFLSMYVWQQGFRDGLEGLIYCVMSGYYEFVRQVKLWERGVSGNGR